MFTSGNAQDMSSREDPLLRGRPGGPHPAPVLPTGPDRSGHLDEETTLTNQNQPTDDDSTIGLTTVANPKRVRLSSPPLTDTSDRD